MDLLVYSALRKYRRFFAKVICIKMLLQPLPLIGTITPQVEQVFHHLGQRAINIPPKERQRDGLATDLIRDFRIET